MNTFSFTTDSPSLWQWGPRLRLWIETLHLASLALGVVLSGCSGWILAKQCGRIFAVATAAT